MLSAPDWTSLSPIPRASWRQTKPDEVELYLGLTETALDAGRPFVDALRVGLKAILCSPEFLLREEPAASDRQTEQATISDEAFASRLSYFLWSSMPDDELLALAGEGRLSRPDVLREIFAE